MVLGGESAPETATLETPSPCLDGGEVAALVARVYGFDCTVKQLASERDQNCLVESADGQRYVLKISNPSEPVSIVDLQIAALDHIAFHAPELPVPRVIRTRSGRVRDAVDLPGASQATVRMLSYLDGIQVRETLRTPGQRFEMGKVLAMLDLALQDFAHPSAQHDLLWNVSTAHRLADKIDSVASPARRALAAEFMQRFITHVLPRLPTLRVQVIHNDYHFYNVLVSPDDQARITGIIDFGDMVRAPLVGEVATAAAFHMAGSADPFEGPAQFVAAYHACLPLLPAEQEIVADLMATRQLVTALISEWRAARYPENRAYIMRHNPAAWEALEQLADLPRADARDRLLRQT